MRCFSLLAAAIACAVAADAIEVGGRPSRHGSFRFRQHHGARGRHGTCVLAGATVDDKMCGTQLKKLGCWNYKLDQFTVMDEKCCREHAQGTHTNEGGKNVGKDLIWDYRKGCGEHGLKTAGEEAAASGRAKLGAAVGNINGVLPGAKSFAHAGEFGGVVDREDPDPSPASAPQCAWVPASSSCEIVGGDGDGDGGDEMDPGAEGAELTRTGYQHGTLGVDVDNDGDAEPMTPSAGEGGGRGQVASGARSLAGDDGDDDWTTVKHGPGSASHREAEDRAHFEKHKDDIATHNSFDALSSA